MLKALRNLYLRYFGKVESAALISGTPAFYYDVFEEPIEQFFGPTHWVFSWYDEHHSMGETHPYPTRDLALLMRDKWLVEAKRKGYITVPVGA